MITASGVPSKSITCLALDSLVIASIEKGLLALLLALLLTFDGDGSKASLIFIVDNSRTATYISSSMPFSSPEVLKRLRMFTQLSANK